MKGNIMGAPNTVDQKISGYTEMAMGSLRKDLAKIEQRVNLLSTTSSPETRREVRTAASLELIKLAAHLGS